jgi:hypothetical protein
MVRMLCVCACVALFCVCVCVCVRVWVCACVLCGAYFSIISYVVGVGGCVGDCVDSRCGCGCVAEGIVDAQENCVRQVLQCLNLCVSNLCISGCHTHTHTHTLTHTHTHSPPTPAPLASVFSITTVVPPPPPPIGCW